MSAFKRIIRTGKSEFNSLLDNTEDPVKMTEQGIRELKLHLENSMKALANVKAMLLREKRKMEEALHKAKDYEQKATLLVQKAQNGELETEEADRLAAHALSRQQESFEQMRRSEQNIIKYEKEIKKLENSIEELKSQISYYQDELVTLKARVSVGQSSQNINKELSQIDSGDTIAMLERMKSKVEETEALAEAYSEIAQEKDKQEMDDEIDGVLDSKKQKVQDALKELKKKMAGEK